MVEDRVQIQDIVGKKIVACRAFTTDRRRKKDLDIVYILFNDGQTIMEFDEQDYYSYHDCSTSARQMALFKNKELWTDIMNNKKGFYPDATMVPGWW